MTPVLLPCHPGCEVQIGDTVPACRVFQGFVDHPFQAPTYCCDEHGWTEPRQPWRELKACGLPAGHDGDHDPDGEAVVWRDPDDIVLQAGRTYGFRARHLDDEGLSAWSAALLVRPQEPPSLEAPR